MTEIWYSPQWDELVAREFADGSGMVTAYEWRDNWNFDWGWNRGEWIYLGKIKGLLK